MLSKHIAVRVSTSLLQEITCQWDHTVLPATRVHSCVHPSIYFTYQAVHVEDIQRLDRKEMMMIR
jgi:hypothetical protein